MAPADMTIAPADSSRYTFDGDETVEQAIDAHQQLIGEAVAKHIDPEHFAALVLIGGYGRGEGGYCFQEGKPAPYNDYDYFVVVKGLDRQGIRSLMPGLKTLAHDLEQQVGVEVDFFPLRLSEISRLEFSLMFAEMRWGHRVVAGNSDVLQGMPAMPFDQLSRAEFTRLMLNRGSLLLLNRIALKRHTVLSPEQHEVFIKYLFKAVLASADAWLASSAQYHPSYPVKQQRLNALQQPVELGRLPEYYALALEARFHPDYSQYRAWEPLQRQAEIEVIWKTALQALEEKRLGQLPPSWLHYAKPAVAKGQSGNGLKARLKNLAVNLRDFGFLSLLRNTGWGLRYPRERLISVLPLLLDDDDRLPDVVTKTLELSVDTDWLTAADRFIALWHKYA